LEILQWVLKLKGLDVVKRDVRDPGKKGNTVPRALHVAMEDNRTLL
jgi:hypothetical protein